MVPKTRTASKFIYFPNSIFIIYNIQSFTNCIGYSESSDEDFDSLIKITDAQQLEKNKEEYEHFLSMIEHISNNHHHDEIFFKKIFQIIQLYQQQIKQTLTNKQIFNIFQNN